MSEKHARTTKVILVIVVLFLSLLLLLIAALVPLVGTHTGDDHTAHQEQAWYPPISIR